MPAISESQAKAVGITAAAAFAATGTVPRLRRRTRTPTRRTQKAQGAGPDRMYAPQAGVARCLRADFTSYGKNVFHEPAFSVNCLALIFWQNR